MIVWFKDDTVTLFQVEMKRLQNETNMLKKELEIEKEKLHTLEAAFDSMKGQGKGL